MVYQHCGMVILMVLKTNSHHRCSVTIFKKKKKNSNDLTSGHVLFSEQLSTVFHFLFSFVLSFSLFLGTSHLWMGWQHSCSSSFNSFKTCWWVTMAVFSLSQLSACVEPWPHFNHHVLSPSLLQLVASQPFCLHTSVSLLITEWVFLACVVFTLERLQMSDSWSIKEWRFLL